MRITKESTIKELKVLFNTTYPGLKLEFYGCKCGSFEGFKQLVNIDENQTVSQLCDEMQEGEISLDPHQTTHHFEKTMEDQFGLHVQIFRKSGDLWLQTSKTDEWTIEHQNARGLETTLSTQN